jgi:hypothetical protein
VTHALALHAVRRALDLPSRWARCAVPRLLASGPVLTVGGVFLRVMVGVRGASGANVRYITRVPVTPSDRDALLARHYPEYVLSARDYNELRDNLEAYANQREEDERGQRRGGAGEPCTHSRIILSCEERIGTVRARERNGPGRRLAGPPGGVAGRTRI